MEQQGELWIIRMQQFQEFWFKLIQMILSLGSWNSQTGAYKKANDAE